MVSSSIFKVFGMTRPGIEPRSPGPLAKSEKKIKNVQWAFFFRVEDRWALIIFKSFYLDVNSRQTLWKLLKQADNSENRKGNLNALYEEYKCAIKEFGLSLNVNGLGLCLPHQYISRLKLYRGCPRGVMLKAMDCGIVVSEFVLQSRYYVHFQTNTLGKGMNPLILPAMG